LFFVDTIPHFSDEIQDKRIARMSADCSDGTSFTVKHRVYSRTGRISYRAPWHIFSATLQAQQKVVPVLGGFMDGAAVEAMASSLSRVNLRFTCGFLIHFGMQKH
jgi:hypothetical protein